MAPGTFTPEAPVLVLKLAKTGQTMTIRLRAPLLVTDPVTPVSVVVKNYAGETLDSGMAAYSASTWTTSDVAGRGTGDPKILPMLSTTSLVPGLYFLVAPSGQFEKIAIQSATATRAQTSGPVSTSFPSGSTIYPATAVYTVPAAVVAAEANLALNVQYYIGDGTMVAYNDDGYVSDTPAMCPLTPEDVYRIWPQLQAMNQPITAGTETQDRLDAVWDNVRSRLLSVGAQPEKFKSVAVLRQVCTYELGFMYAIGGVDPSGNKNPIEFRDLVADVLKAKWNELFTTEQFVDHDETGVKEADDRQRMEGRRIEW